MLKRCPWAEDDALMRAYHDEEWGVPIRDDQRLFEFLILEGAQAGLRWQTILRRRKDYRKAFDHFNAEKIVRYTPQKIQALLVNPGIIRNRLKIAATVANARAFLDISLIIFGNLWTACPKKIVGVQKKKFRLCRLNRKRCLKIYNNAVLNLSEPLFVMLTCKLWAW
jgi:DNA-3-methyladenine glycosylase I